MLHCIYVYCKSWNKPAQQQITWSSPLSCPSTWNCLQILSCECSVDLLYLKYSLLIQYLRDFAVFIVVYIKSIFLKLEKMQKVVILALLSISIISILAEETVTVKDTSPPPIPLEFTQVRESIPGEAPCRIMDKFLEHGKEWTHPEKCVSFFCYDGKVLDIEYCDELKTTGTNCVIVPIRPNLDYPYCCPKVICWSWQIKCSTNSRQ